MRSWMWGVVLVAAGALGWAAASEDVSPLPPVAEKVARESSLHGDKIVDHYFWLRQKEDPRVRAYLQAENAYTDAVMKPTAAFQEALYREMLGRIQQTDLTVPYRRGDYFYYSRTEEGKQYRIECRKKGSLSAPEEVTLDLNELAKGERFLGLGAYQVSDEGNLLAYSTDVTGFRDFTLYAKDLRSGGSHRMAVPEPVYSLFPSTNVEFDTSTYRYSYQSLTTPPSIYDYDMEQRERELLKQEPIRGGYDASGYRSERLHARAMDGTRIPLSLVYKKGLKRDGTNPLLLTGYGSYGAPSNVFFSSMRLSLLNRGAVYAIAHIRGGGDLGKKWHDAGRMLKKKHTFTDFIAVAEHLIARKYTSRDRLVIEGGSAGGLLIGAVVNMRPELFRAAVAHVPFVDIINTMSDPSLPLTVPEFEEWGNPQIKEQYDYIKTYCPYTNVGRKAYPAMLVRTSFNDSQVMYWEPAKYVAKMRALKTDTNPLLFKIVMAGGHGGPSGRYDRWRETAFDYAFILTQMGIDR